MSVCVVYRELLEEGKHILAQAEIVDAECDAWLLLEHVSGMNRAQFFLNWKRIIGECSEKEQSIFHCSI